MASKRNASPLQSPSKRNAPSVQTPSKRQHDALAEMTWNGVVSRPVSGKTKEMLDSDLFTPVSTQMDTQRRLIGNAEGRAMFTDHFGMRGLIEQTRRELSELRESHDDLRSSTAVLKKSHDDLRAAACQLRSHALNEWCNRELSTGDRDLRNASVHGGDIIQDIKAINSMESVSPTISLRWRQAFEKNYGVDHDKCETLIDSIRSDRRMVWTFNTLANVRVLHKWCKENSDARETIDANYSSIIEAWLSRPEDPFESAEVVDWYNTAMNLFYS